MSLNILIVGAGVGGCALAAFLQNTDTQTNVTVIERSPALRVAGQQIDVQGQGVAVMRKAGLLKKLRAHCVTEGGMEFVDSQGKSIATFGVSPAEGHGVASMDGKQLGGMTQEYEIMRGDMVRMLYDESLERRRLRAEREKGEGKEGGGSLTYDFGKTVTELHHDDKEGVDVVFSDGQRRRFDLVVAADGQASRTRRIAFGPEFDDASFVPFGLFAAFYSIPGLEGEGDLAKAYNAPGRKVVMTRTGGRPITQVYLLNAQDTEKLKKIHGEPEEQRKQKWIEAYKDCGWQSERLLSGMKTCEDFYVAEGGLVKNPKYCTGRVALLGESGYGGTFTGVGTELALSGAYVLAGEIARNGSDMAQSLQNYEQIMRTPVGELQATPSMVRIGLRMFLPNYSLEIWFLRTLVWAICKSGIALLLMKLVPAGKEGWKIPEYQELNLES